MAELLIKGSFATLYMTTLSTLLAYVVGMPLGIVLILTREGGIKRNPVIYHILEAIINVWRSIPFFILMLTAIPFIRFVVGKAIGPTAVCVALFIGAVPFVARLVEQSLLEVGAGIVESCIVMGSTTWQIVLVLLREAIPSLIRGVSITFIMLIGYSAMAGFLGGGGLGDIAVRFGLYRYEYETMLYTLLVIIVIVMVVQWMFAKLAKHVDRRIR